MTDRDDTRTVLAVSGADREKLLQGLVTNDVRKLAAGPVYAALLTPQGKYLADFILVEDSDRILVDADAGQAGDLLKRLTMYRLRADVTIAPTDLPVARGLGDPPSGAFADPRDPALGWRQIGAAVPESESDADWTAQRVALGVPQAGAELIPNDSYILEMGFERLNGVDFRKGCYVGQEVTARMKHKTELRKGLARVRVEGPAEPGTPILRDGREVGTLHSRAGDQALAYLRFDRAGEGMTAGDARIHFSRSD